MCGKLRIIEKIFKFITYVTIYGTLIFMLIVTFHLVRDGGLIFYEPSILIAIFEFSTVLIALMGLTIYSIKKYRNWDISEEWR